MQRIGLSHGLKLAGMGYLVLLALVVIVGVAGWFPGSGERGPDATWFGHPYRISMALATGTLAVYLGIWSGVAGRRWDRWVMGFGALVGGGVLTGVALAFLPMILYTHDQYPVTFMWVVGGAPLGFVTWLVTTIPPWRPMHTANG